jgi:predicted dehydrogenase
MIRIGIIGFGGMGRVHFDAYQKIEGCRVIALADIDPERAKKDGCRSCTEYRELLTDPEIDAVDVCTATPLHAEICTAALKAGKHVICEKPMARTQADADAIVAAAEASDKFFMVAQCMRFWPEWAYLKQAIDDGRFGKLRSASFRRTTSGIPGWFRDGKLSGGAILDLHVHDVDFVYWLLGMPKAVLSRGYKGHTGEIDHVFTQYIYDDVPIVTAEGGWAMADKFPFAMVYVANFENATITSDSSQSPMLKLYHNGQITTPQTPPGTGYEHELRYFIECVRTNRRPTTATAVEAAATFQMIQAETESIRSGNAVRLQK